jgi:hypothetical protein
VCCRARDLLIEQVTIRLYIPSFTDWVYYDPVIELAPTIGTLSRQSIFLVFFFSWKRIRGRLVDCLAAGPTPWYYIVLGVGTSLVLKEKRERESTSIREGICGSISNGTAVVGLVFFCLLGISIFFVWRYPSATHFYSFSITYFFFVCTLYRALFSHAKVLPKDGRLGNRDARGGPSNREGGGRSRSLRAEHQRRNECMYGLL